MCLKPSILFLLPLVLFIFLCNNSLAGGTQYMSATTADPVRGLVYISNTNESFVDDSKYKYFSPGGNLVGSSSNNGEDVVSCYLTTGGAGCQPADMYFWAKPARGYDFSSWEKRGNNYPSHPVVATGGCDTSDEINVGPYDGIADTIQGSAGASQSTWFRPIANFVPAAKYFVTYEVPVGGSYEVNYSYLQIKDNGIELKGNYTEKTFYTQTDNYYFIPTSESMEVESYAADSVYLYTSSSNFIGWYEDGLQVSTSKSYVYKITKTATIGALFNLGPDSLILNLSDTLLTTEQVAEKSSNPTKLIYPLKMKDKIPKMKCY